MNPSLSGPQPRLSPAELSDLLRQARQVLATFAIAPSTLPGAGVQLWFERKPHLFHVSYDPTSLRPPLCTCPDYGRQQMRGGPCAHAMAALLRDPAAKGMLLRYLL